MSEVPMRIVVVGGNGFIGSHFVAASVAAGHDVIVSGHNPTPRFAHGAQFEFISGGLAALADRLDVLERADAVCHFASSSIPSSSNADPVGDIESNLVGTVKLMDAMRRAGTKRLVYLSSGGAIYGHPISTPISEDHPTNPMSSYGIVKLSVEKYIALFAGQHGLRPTIIRPANPYGPGQGTIGQLGAVTTFLNLALTEKKAIIWGDGSAVRDFIYISDLVDMVLRALERDVTGVFNAGSGAGTSLSELMALVEAITGKALKREYLQARPFDPPAVVLDISRACKALDWTPRVDLETGIRLTAQAMQ